MPVFQHDGALHYFAHVPKCAGQSVEDYLERRFGHLGFLDNDHYRRPERERWSRSSPQHILTEDLGRLVPPSWLASSFAVVRHPIDRIVSAYNFQSAVLRRIPLRMTIAEWFEEGAAATARDPFHQDNHLRPQTAFVPAGSDVFRLEDGMDGVVAHLDRLTGSDGPAGGIARHNSTTQRQGDMFEAQPLTAAFIDRIVTEYATDFARFGYDSTPDPALRAQVPVQRDNKSPESLREMLRNSRIARRLLRLAPRMRKVLP